MRRGRCCPMGTGGGVMVDVRARVQREDGESILGMYTVGNTPANTFGRRYPGAGATIGHRLAFADIAARHMAERKWHFTDGHWSPARSSGRNLRRRRRDRKSTRLNSSHVAISYAVFCLKKKKNKDIYNRTLTCTWQSRIPNRN